MFCLNYYPYKDYMDEVDELKIKYRPADRSLEDFLEKYHDKSIVIELSNTIEDLDIKLLKSLSDKYQNIKFIIKFNDKDLLKTIQENEMPFFFSNFVTTPDQMHGLISYHPTDMYICEDLGFSLDKVSAVLHDNGIRVRVIPNICQSSFPSTPAIRQFFIRPNDISIYSTFVDVFEIFSDEERQRVLLKIYKQEKWDGLLKEVIPSFNNDLDNRFILDSFGMVRSKCGKRCVYKPESCNICDRFIEAADSLKEHRIIVKKVKKKD